MKDKLNNIPNYGFENRISQENSIFLYKVHQCLDINMEKINLSIDNISNNIDRYLGWFGFFTGILLLLFLPSAYSEIGILIISTCLIYLITRKKILQFDICSNWFETTNIKTILYVLNILFFILFTLLLVTYNSVIYSLPLTYYLIFILLILLITIEISIHRNNKFNSSFILFKIFIISLTFRAGILFQYPNVIGTDAWYHMWLSNIIGTGIDLSLLFNYGNEYASFPIFHILLSETMQLTSYTYKVSSAVTILFYEVVGVIFIYLISKNFFNRKIGLLSALILAITDSHIRFGWWIVPPTLCITTIIIILYLMFDGKSVAKKFLIIILFFVLIFSHPFSAMIFMVILLITFLWSTIAKQMHHSKAEIMMKKLDISFGMIALFSVAWIGYWIFYSNVFNMLIGRIINIIFLGTSNDSYIFSQIEINNLIIFNRLFFLISLFFTLFCILYSIKKYRNTDFFVICVLFSSLLFLLFITQFLIKSPDTEFSRWFLYLQTIQALITPIGIILVSGYFKEKWIQWLTVSLIVLVMSSVSITGFNATLLSPINNEFQNVPALAESESKSFETIYFNYNKVIVTDMQLLYYQYSIQDDSQQLTNPLKNTKYLEDVNIGNTDNGTILLIRDYIFRRPIILSKGGAMKMNRTLMQDSLMEYRYSTIYDSKTVRGYVNLSVPERKINNYRFNQ